jgi:hypothetical protein
VPKAAEHCIQPQLKHCVSQTSSELKGPVTSAKVLRFPSRKKSLSVRLTTLFASLQLPQLAMPIQIRTYSPHRPQRDIEGHQAIRLPFRSRLNFLRLLLPPATLHLYDSESASENRVNAHTHFLLRNIELLTDFEDDSSDDDSEIETHYMQQIRRQRHNANTLRPDSDDSTRDISTDVYESDDSDESNDTMQNLEESLFNDLYRNGRPSLEEEKSIQDNEIDDQELQDLFIKRASDEKDSTIYLTADGNYDPMVSFVARVLDGTFGGTPRSGIVCCKDVLPVGDEPESQTDLRGLQTIIKRISRMIEELPSSSIQRSHVYDYIQSIDAQPLLDR